MHKNKSMFESVQHRAERWIESKCNPSTYQWTKSSDVCLEELKWPTLEYCRYYYAAILMLYSILHDFSPLSFEQYFQINALPERSHPLTLTLNY